MKINPIQDAVGYLNVVREKKDAGQDQSRGQNQPGSDPNAEQDDEPATAEAIDAAIGEFQTQSPAQSNGLQANVSGKGPGLKVVLTDATGQVVRQFTGEEFLKLREAAQSSGKRGRLLDQKF